VVLVLGQGLLIRRHDTVEQTSTGLVPRVEGGANHRMSTAGLRKKGPERSVHRRVRDLLHE